MSSLPNSIDTLIQSLARLPGIGPRSAERIALHLVQSEPGVARELAESIVRARERILFCDKCGALSEKTPCDLCSDQRREAGMVCVVERPVDIITLERSRTFRGQYHVLGGKLSPLNSIEPEDLRIASLEQRLEREPIRELVIALGTDVEGDATSYYLAKRLARPGLKITRIAHGLPAGSGLEFADELTLTRALEGRRELI